jgi:hypothetical protein
MRLIPRLMFCSWGLGFALAGCAATSASTRPPTVAQEPSMSAVTTPITAEDIGRRVLKLIDSIRNAQDLAPEHIENVMGVAVEYNDEDRNIYGVSGKLDDGGSYSLVSTPEKLGEKPKRFALKPAEAGEVHGQAACKMTFEDYERALLESGFSGRPMRPFPGSDAVYFSRGPLRVTAYRDTDPRAPDVEKPACLSRLYISV